MPIGKNSIKRVSNGGYSSVKTEAPDMENSTEIKEVPCTPDPEVKPEVKKPVTKKPAAKKPAAKKEKNEAPAYVNVGRELPTHLL